MNSTNSKQTVLKLHSLWMKLVSNRGLIGLILDNHWVITNWMEFFLNGARLSWNFVNSLNLINHWIMNWSQFKDPVSYMCLDGTVLASWSVTEWVVVLRTFNCYDKYFCYWIRWTHWKLLGRTPISQISLESKLLSHPLSSIFRGIILHYSEY